MGWWTGSDDQGRTDARLAAIERKLQAVLDHLGIEEVEPTYPEVLDHVRRGETVKAVKAYRERTGAGLVEAKRAVDRLAGREH